MKNFFLFRLVLLEPNFKTETKNMNNRLLFFSFVAGSFLRVIRNIVHLPHRGKRPVLDLVSARSSLTLPLAGLQLFAPRSGLKGTASPLDVGILLPSSLLLQSSLSGFCSFPTVPSAPWTPVLLAKVPLGSSHPLSTRRLQSARSVLFESILSVRSVRVRILAAIFSKTVARAPVPATSGVVTALPCH